VPLDVILDRRLLIISGKGGVGKTTIAAALGILAARHGRRVLIAEVQGKRGLSRLFGTNELSEVPIELRPDLFAMNISPEEALQEYFQVQLHMRRIARPFLNSHLVYYITHAAPGLRDLLMLGKVWYAATHKKDFDLIVLDTPASGHAVSMLKSPEGVIHAIPFGPLAGPTRKISKWLQDPEEVSIHLVTLAEEMPVNETIETTGLLEQRLHMDVAGVFVNMLYPPPLEDQELAAEFEELASPQQLITRAESSNGRLDSEAAPALLESADFYRARRHIQQEHRAVLERTISKTAPIVDVPFLFTESFGAPELDLIADLVEAQLKE
jgi:anion-transporting  ArsA/GET3 family ATPase